MNDNNKILVTGAGGFLGKDIIYLLLKRGWQVKAMIRNATGFPCIHDSKLEIVYADMRDLQSLTEAVKNVFAVVHLAAAKSDEPDSNEINVEGVRRLISACGKEGCKRIINISTQSVKIKRKGIYAQTKLEAEKILHDSGLSVTTLRPSVVYGEQLLGVFGSVVTFVQKLPFVPILGGGKWVSAPIFIRDVSEAIISCIENDSTMGKRYDLGGPDKLSFDDFIDRICSELGIKRLKVHIPFSLSLAAAQILAKLLKRPPITVSNILGSNQDTDIDITPAQKDFRFSPMRFNTGIKLALGKTLRPTSNTSEHVISDDRESIQNRLRMESKLMTRYILGCFPSNDLSDRYIAASQKLFGDHSEKESPELQFIHRYPWTLPFIDASAGLLNPQSIVRKKILLMMAILETTPIHAEFFLHRQEPPVKLVINLIWNGLRSVVKLGIGIPILFIARRG